MNVFVCDGRLTRDAETGTTGKGTTMCKFSVANDVGFGDNKTTQFVECTLWGKRAESVGQYLTKGLQVFLTGELERREWQKKDNTMQVVMQLHVRELSFGARPKAAVPSAPRQQALTDDVPAF